MNALYENLISAASLALGEYDEVASLLEYPEVMADKAYYLSLLEKYNSLNFIKERLDAFKAVLEEEDELNILLSEVKDGNGRSEVFKEISSLKRKEALYYKQLSSALGKTAKESAYCRIRLKGNSRAVFEKFVSLLNADLLSHGIKTTVLKSETGQIDFLSDGEGALSRITPLCGCHRISVSGGRSDYLLIAVTTFAEGFEIDESQIKIDVFHSHGAGGQNINKVETAVRATYLPFGISVVCQDERSQLKNKRRAVENLTRKVRESVEAREKQRIEEDINIQFSIKNTSLSFDTSDSSMTDIRLIAQNKFPLSMKAEEFTRYLDAVTAVVN